MSSLDKSEKAVHDIQLVRDAMVKSAECHQAAAPATLVDINDFYNSCIGCVAAIRQLQANQSAAITESLWGEIHNFLEIVDTMRMEVTKLDMSYRNDAPLVKCLSRLMNKGDTVLRTIRGQCNLQMLHTFGEDWMKETNDRYAADLAIVIKDLQPCYQYALGQMAKRSANNTSFSTGFGNKPAAMSASPDKAAMSGSGDQAGPQASAQPASILTGGPKDTATRPDKHITFVPVEEKDHSRPPFDVAHFKMHNYLNLPQFTGVPEHTLPIHQKEMPPAYKTPLSEEIYVAEKTGVLQPKPPVPQF